MKVGCVYINAGKGHYIPAKAIADALESQGVGTELLDFFQMINAPLLDRLNQRLWRWQLKFPKVEQKVNARADRNLFAKRMLPLFFSALHKRHFVGWFEKHRFDALICTHYMPSLVLSEFMHALGYDCPVFAYSSDVFTTPRLGLSRYLKRFYISTEEGVNHVAESGFPADRVVLSSFPIQTACLSVQQLSKREAREKVGLENQFTLLINLGGEGIGTISIIEALERENAEVQVVLVGGMNEKDTSRFAQLQAQCTFVTVVIAGFVHNIYDYLYACDIVVGKAGINAMLEAMYLKRPFLVTTVYYTVKPAAEYFERYGIGWYEPEVEQQVRIITDCLHHPRQFEMMDAAFQHVPITFGGTDIALDLVKTVRPKVKSTDIA